MELSTITFYIFAAITLLSALYILFTKNVLYAAFALMVTFLGVAGIFIFSGATFIAVTQLLVYVGGILILIVFGVMLTNRLNEGKVVTGTYQKFWGVLVAGGLFALLFKAILQANFGAVQWIETAASGEEKRVSLQQLGLRLMTDYVLAFEIVGVLLLLALIGAVYMASAKSKQIKNAD